MSPSTEPADERRDTQPSVVEVAALTRRLRELSNQGRHADPGERAVFLADNQALLARIVGYDESPVIQAPAADDDEDAAGLWMR